MAVDDRRVLGILAEPVDEGPVDLQHVDGEPLQVAERRVAGAEVVDGQLDAERAQVLQHLEPGRRVGHQRGLGDLEAERRRLEAAALERLPRPGRRRSGWAIWRAERLTRMRRARVGALAPPLAGLTAGLLEHPGAEVEDQAASPRPAR